MPVNKIFSLNRCFSFRFCQNCCKGNFQIRKIFFTQKSIMFHVGKELLLRRRQALFGNGGKNHSFPLSYERKRGKYLVIGQDERGKKNERNFSPPLCNCVNGLGSGNLFQTVYILPVWRPFRPVPHFLEAVGYTRKISSLAGFSVRGCSNSLLGLVSFDNGCRMKQAAQLLDDTQISLDAIILCKLIAIQIKVPN